MPNLRIVHDNAVARAASLVASTTAGGLVAANLARDTKSSVHRAAGMSVNYTMSWSTLEPIGCIALPFCNLSPTAQIRVRATNEASTTNLLKYTDTFNVSSPTWCLPGLGTSNITANYALAPDGAMTADRFTTISGGGTLQYLDQAVSGLADNSVHSASLFAQAGELEKVLLLLRDKAGADTVLEVNVADGRTTYSSQPAGQSVTVDMTPVPAPAPAGWYRLRINSWNTRSGASSPRVQIYPARHNSPGRDGTMWTRSGLTVDESTVQPRLYPAWPIDIVTESTGSTAVARFLNTSVRGEIGRTVVVEQTMKQIDGTSRYMGLVITGAGGSGQGAIVDLATGAISFKTNGAEVKNATVESAGNGYWKLRLEVTPSVTGNFGLQIRINAVGNTLAATYVASSPGSTFHVTRPYAYLKDVDNTYPLMVSTSTFTSSSSDPARGLNLWGAMLEAGPEVTSYYPSMGATPGVRPAGYMDSWQGTGYDSGWVPACPAPAIRLRGFTPAQASSAYAFGGGACARHWLPAEMQARAISVDIADPNNLQGYIEAACLVAGPVWSPQYNASTASVSVIDRTELSRSAAGDQLADPGTISRKVPVDLRAMPEDDRSQFLALVRNSRAYPVLLSVFPGHSNLALERDFTVYGRRTKDSDIAYQFAGAYSTTLEIEEI